MKKNEFDEIVRFCEGAFSEDLTAKQRDAWWILMREESASEIMRVAVELARSERSKFGMPKPGQFLSQVSSYEKTLKELS